MRNTRLSRFMITILLGVFISTLLRLCWPAVALGQVAPQTSSSRLDLNSGLDNYSRGMSNLLVKNADQKEFSMPLDKKEFSRDIQQELLNLTERFGKIILHADGKLVFPEGKIMLSNNTAWVESGLAIEHQIKGVNLRPHFQFRFKGEASDKDFIAHRLRKLGSAELQFEGLLLKGVPIYLQRNFGELLKKDGLVLQTDPKNNSKATLSKVIEIPQKNQIGEFLFEGINLIQLKTIESKLSKNKTKILENLANISDLKAQLELARSNMDTSLVKDLKEKLRKAESKLQEAQSDLQNAITQKHQALANLPLKSSFICAPEFMREFKFPIYERRASASGQGGSASGGIGVSGDIVIDINKPTCEFAFVPPFKGQSSTYADISITSNGYLGARGEASGEKDFNVAFLSEKYGKYTLSKEELRAATEFEGDEKNAIDNLVLKSLEDAKNDPKLLDTLATKLEDKFVPTILSSIESFLIGFDSSPFNISTVCSLFRKFERPGFKPLSDDEKSICWVANLASPPQKPLEALDSLLVKKAQLEDEAARIPTKLQDAEKAVVDISNEIADTVCKVDVTGICERLNSSLNEAIKVKDDLVARSLEVPKLILDAGRKVEDWGRYNRWAIYSTPRKIRDVAKKFVHDRILSPLTKEDISKAVAQKLLDFFWDIEKGARKVDELFDLTEQFLQPLTPEVLSISVAASGRIALSSRATLIETRPQFTADSTLEFKEQDQRPVLNLKFSAYQNGPEGEKGRIGGLDLLRFNFDAQAIACFGGKVESKESCSSGSKKKIIALPPFNEAITPTVKGKQLSKEKKEILADSIPL